jgi:hypothetical protein
MDVIVNYSRHLANFVAFPDADLGDGYLDLMELSAGPISQNLRNFSALAEINLCRPAPVAKIQRIRASLTRPAAIMIDGEIFKNVCQFEATVAPRAIRWQVRRVMSLILVRICAVTLVGFTSERLQSIESERAARPSAIALDQIRCVLFDHARGIVTLIMAGSAWLLVSRLMAILVARQILIQQQIFVEIRPHYLTAQRLRIAGAFMINLAVDWVA